MLFQAIFLSLLDLSGKLKSLFRSNNRNEFIDDSRCRNGALDDLNQLRCGSQRGADDTGKRKGNP